MTKKSKAAFIVLAASFCLFNLVFPHALLLPRVPDFYYSVAHNFMKPDSYNTEVAVYELIPKGTEISNAQEIMEADGFGCEMKHDDLVFEIYGESNFLHCDSGERFFGTQTKTWKILFIPQDGLVKNVRAEVYLSGL